jgi:hypothetical protein
MAESARAGNRDNGAVRALQLHQNLVQNSTRHAIGQRPVAGPSSDRRAVSLREMYNQVRTQNPGQIRQCMRPVAAVRAVELGKVESAISLRCVVAEKFADIRSSQ